MSSPTENIIERMRQMQNENAESNEKMKKEIREVESENTRLVNDIEMSQRKIEGMLEKARALERRNVELNNKVSELTNNIKEVKNCRIQNLVTFEKEIKNLTKQMTHLLPAEYSPNTSSNPVEKLNNENEGDDFSMEEKESILQLFREERDKLAEQLRALQEKKEKLEAEVQHLTNSQ